MISSLHMTFLQKATIFANVSMLPHTHRKSNQMYDESAVQPAQPDMQVCHRGI